MKKSFLCAIVGLVLAAVFCLPVFASYDVDFEKIDALMQKAYEKNNMPAMAVVVVDKDSVLFSKTYGKGADENTPFIVGSLSKSFTAVAVMQLVENGLVDLDKSISTYCDFSEWFKNPEDADRITVRNLLNQSSGLTTYQTYGKLESTSSFGKHKYSNYNYNLLGEIIESVSGMTYADYMEKNVFDALGMTHSAANYENGLSKGLIDGCRNFFGFPLKWKTNFPKDEEYPWIMVPAGYLMVSTSDMAKYLQMYLNGGREGVLSSDGVNSVLYDGVGERYKYSMGWYYTETQYSKPVLYHTGSVENFNTRMFILPEEGIGVAVFVNMNDFLVVKQTLTDIALPLIGEQSKLSDGHSFAIHFLADAFVALILALLVCTVVRLGKWKEKKYGVLSIVLDLLAHLVLPLVLALLPVIMATPYFVAWLYVTDMCIAAFSLALLLFGVGVYKLVYKLK